jgi:NAD(P)-dependent dehydrogenase (short-subunit alcohol dehydrogenase family)
VDVRESAQVQAMVAQTVERYARVDILYHTAVDAKFVNEQDRRLTELPDEIWSRMIELVLTGTFHCAKYVARQMLAQRSGSIILSATVDALIGCAGLDSYTAAKGGVVSLTRSFAAGMAPDGVRVNTICPGFVSTEPQKEWLDRPEAQRAMNMLHLLPLPLPEQVVPFMLYLASDESSAVTGGVFPIDAGYMAFKANVHLNDLTAPQPEPAK